MRSGKNMRPCQLEQGCLFSGLVNEVLSSVQVCASLSAAACRHQKKREGQYVGMPSASEQRETGATHPSSRDDPLHNAVFPGCAMVVPAQTQTP